MAVVVEDAMDVEAVGGGDADEVADIITTAITVVDRNREGAAQRRDRITGGRSPHQPSQLWSDEVEQLDRMARGMFCAWK